MWTPSTIIIIATLASLLTLWRDEIIAGKKIIKEEETDTETRDELENQLKNEKTKRIKILSSFFILLTLFFTIFQIHISDNASKSANREKQLQHSIDSTRYASDSSKHIFERRQDRQAHKSIDSIRDIQVDLYVRQILAGKSIDSIQMKSAYILKNLSKVDLAIKGSVLKLDQNNYGLKESLEKLSTINERIQYPLPRSIVINLKIAWSVQEVNNEINSIIKREKKKAIVEGPYSLPYKFLVDTSYSIFPKLYLGFKSLKLNFTKNGSVAKYEVSIWPRKFTTYNEKFYYADDVNKFKDAYFVYDSSIKRIYFNLLQCPLLLTSVSSKMSSLLDIDSSRLTLEINPDRNDIYYELNIEHPPTYVFGYQFYDAHDDNLHALREAVFALSVNFNEMFNISYRNILGRQFKIDTFKLGR